MWRRARAWAGGHLPAGSPGRRFAAGAFWSLVGTALSQGLRVLAFMFAARLLGKAVFGQLGILQATAGMAGVLAGLGAGLTAARHVAGFRHTDPRRAGRTVGLCLLLSSASGLLFAVALLALAPFLAGQVMKTPGLTPELRMMAGFVLVSTVFGAQTGVLAGLEAFRKVAQIGLLQGLLTLPAIIVGARAGELFGVAAALTAAGFVTCLAQQSLLLRECRRAGIVIARPGRSEWEMLGRFSVPAMLCGVLSTPAYWVAASILVNQPNGFEEMGAFSAANQWRALIVFLPAILERSTLPVLSDLNARGDLAAYRRTLFTHLTLAAGAAAACALLVSVLSPFIMRGYGQGFGANGPVLALLAWASVFNAATTAAGTAIISRGDMWWAMLFNLLWAICLIGAAAVLAPRFGATGLSAAFLISYAAHAGWTCSYWLVIERRLRQALRGGGARSAGHARRVPGTLPILSDSDKRQTGQAARSRTATAKTPLALMDRASAGCGTDGG